MGIIELNSVSYEYNTGKETAFFALNNVSLSIQPGEFLCIVGHNGSGKSTLAKLLNGLLLPTSGTVLVKGMDTKDEKRALDIRKTVGLCFQNPDNQIVTTIVEDDVAFAPENLGIDPKEIRTRVNMALKAVGMESYATAAPHMLSGGQKQRVAIAGLLAMQPEVLVLDEATSMLDPAGKAEVIKIIQRLNSEGITIVMITQYMEEAIIADRVVVMSQGSIALEGTPKQVFAQASALRSLRLDVPAVVDLRNRLIARGMLPTHALTAEELAEHIAKIIKTETGSLKEDTLRVNEDSASR